MIAIAKAVYRFESFENSCNVVPLSDCRYSSIFRAGPYHETGGRMVIIVI